MHLSHSNTIHPCSNTVSSSTISLKHGRLSVLDAVEVEGRGAVGWRFEWRLFSCRLKLANRPNAFLHMPHVNISSVQLKSLSSNDFAALPSLFLYCFGKVTWPSCSTGWMSVSQHFRTSTFTGVKGFWKMLQYPTPDVSVFLQTMGSKFRTPFWISRSLATEEETSPSINRLYAHARRFSFYMSHFFVKESFYKKKWVWNLKTLLLIKNQT